MSKLALIAAAALVLAMPIRGQQTASSPTPQAEQSAAPARPESINAEAGGRQLAEASNRAAGESEDENAEFKYSPVVKKLAHATGMSVAGAYWLSMVLNFAVVALLIFAFMKSKLPGMFRARTESIQKGMAEAYKASEDAKKRLADVEVRLSKLDSDIAELRAASEKEAAAEEVRIRAAAEEDVKKVLQSAEQEIDAAARQARRELKSLAAGLAVDLAAKKLKIDTATDQAMVRDFVEQLGKDGQ